MKKPLWLIASLLVLEVLVIMILVPGKWTRQAIDQEAGMVEQQLGLETREWIRETATDWYQSSFIESGIYDGMYYTMIPTEEQKARSKGIESMGGWWFEIVEDRLNAFSESVYQFYTRVALFTAWAPYMILLLLPAMYDGYMTWRIKRTNFDYASPIVHRYSLRLAFGSLTCLGVAFLAPIAINPVVIPIIVMMCCVLLGLSIGNMQKRV